MQKSSEKNTLQSLVDAAEVSPNLRKPMMDLALAVAADCIAAIEQEMSENERIGGSADYDNALYDACRAIRERYGMAEPTQPEGAGLYI